VIHLIPTNLKIDFLGKSRPFVLISTIAALLSIAGLATKGLNYGIDFTGGAEVGLKVPADWDISRLRAELASGGLGEANIVQIGAPEEHEYLVKVQASADKLNQVSSQVSQVMTQKAGAGKFSVERVDVVGPAAGASLRRDAMLSILYVMLCIVIYITFRFDVRYAPGVLRALGVDVIITLGIWVLLQHEFNLTVLAAMLTIAGYSCNDTIVIYDRIRDYVRDHPTWSLEQAINRSINLNLGRTIITTGCTLLVVVSMFVLGGPVLRDFSLPLLIGFTVSVPSTIFVANPMILYMEKRRLAKQAKLGVGAGKPKQPARKIRPEPTAQA
jgi:preprotein translocase subunit SecF